MYDNIGIGVPYLYDYINMANSIIDPSTVHAERTATNRFFERYLMEKAISVFEWKMPKSWARNYVLYVLYCWGFISVVQTDRYGIIPQACSLRGHDIFYQPTNAVITNPLLTGILEPEIGTQCTLIKLQPDYGGILDLVQYYANLMAIASESIATNLLNTKLAYVFGAQNKNQAESFKKMFDRISSGEPAVFIDKNLLDENGKPQWFTFSQNIKENYIVPDLLSDLRKIESMFATEVGIPNANTDKKERLITDEVNANNFETRSKCELWLEELQKGCKEASEMFGIELSVDWREDLQEGGSYGEPVDSRTIQLRSDNIRGPRNASR